MVHRNVLATQLGKRLASKAMKKKEINIEVSLGAGKAVFRAITSDLSEDYVLINSDYRS